MVAFATSPTPVDREGWLNKRSEVNRGYQRRWFLLKGNILFYFDRRGDKEPVGMIVLEGCTIELAEDEDHFAFKIVFHGPNNRSYLLGAESQVKSKKTLNFSRVTIDDEITRIKFVPRYYFSFVSTGIHGTMDEGFSLCQLRLHEVDGRRVAASVGRSGRRNRGGVSSA